MQELAEAIFSRYLNDRPKADIAIGASYGPEHRYAFLSGAKSPYAGIDSHSVFETGSISKTFAATLLEKAVLSGYTEINAPVTEYVPELKDGIAPTATLYELAVHKSGLPYDFPYRLTRAAREEDRDPWALLGRDDLFTYLATEKRREPNRKWRYSNIGYCVLAIALEKVFGADYPTLVRQHVFEPLQMQDAVSSATIVDCTTQGHCGNRRSPYSESPLLYGPGDVRASARDLLHYIDAALYAERAPYDNFGKYLFEPDPERKPPKIRQGLGWALLEEDRGWLVVASGTTSGFSCTAMFSPAKRKGVVVLSNHVDIGGFADLVRTRLRKSAGLQGATQLFYDAL